MRNGQPATRPLHNALLARSHLPTSLRRPAKSRPEREVGEQPYCHTNAVDVGLAQIQFVFSLREAHVSAR